MKLTKPDINCATAFLFLIIFLFGCNGIVAQSSSNEIDNASKKLKIHPVVTNQTEVSIQQKDNTGVSSTKGSPEKFLPLYTAEGILYMEYLMAGKASQGDALFSISVDALGRWNIVLRQKKGAVEYMNCDGTNIFHLFGLPQNVPLDLPIVLKEDLSTGQNATYHPNETTAISVTPLAEVYSGSFPTTYNRFGILWLAFAGGHYLETTNDIPNLLEFDPINNPFAWCTDFFYKNEVESSFPLLLEGSFIVNTNLIKGDTVAYQKIKEPQGESTFKWLQQRLEIMQKIPAELFLRGSYSLIESKQIGTLKVPVLFSTSSRPDILIRQDDSDGNRFIGQVTNIIVAPGEYFLVPQIEGKFTIHDFRFMKRTKEGFWNSAVYESTNNWELDKHSERLQEIGMGQRLIPRLQKSPRNRTYYVSRGLLTMVILAPLGFFVIRRWRKQG